MLKEYQDREAGLNTSLPPICHRCYTDDPSANVCPVFGICESCQYQEVFYQKDLVDAQIEYELALDVFHEYNVHQCKVIEGLTKACSASQDRLIKDNLEAGSALANKYANYVLLMCRLGK